MVEITEVIDQEPAEDFKFLGKDASEMSREELLTVIAWLADERDELEEDYITAQRQKANLLGKL